jgi:hypothetical protein
MDCELTPSIPQIVRGSYVDTDGTIRPTTVSLPVDDPVSAASPESYAAEVAAACERCEQRRQTNERPALVQQDPYDNEINRFVETAVVPQMREYLVQQALSNPAAYLALCQ